MLGTVEPGSPAWKSGLRWPKIIVILCMSLVISSLLSPCPWSMMISSQIVLIRSGDTIVTINDWTITLMDKPEVALHLFQAKP